MHNWLEVALSHDPCGICPPHEFLKLLTTNYIFLYSLSRIDSSSVSSVSVFSFSFMVHRNEAAFEILFFNWYSLHARLNNSHYEVWSYKEKKLKKVKAYRKSN